MSDSTPDLDSIASPADPNAVMVTHFDAFCSSMHEWIAKSQVAAATSDYADLLFAIGGARLGDQPRALSRFESAVERLESESARLPASAAIHGPLIRLFETRFHEAVLQQLPDNGPTSQILYQSQSTDRTSLYILTRTLDSLPLLTPIVLESRPYFELPSTDPRANSRRRILDRGTREARHAQLVPPVAESATDAANAGGLFERIQNLNRLKRRNREATRLEFTNYLQWLSDLIGIGCPADRGDHAFHDQVFERLIELLDAFNPMNALDSDLTTVMELLSVTLNVADTFDRITHPAITILMQRVLDLVPQFSPADALRLVIRCGNSWLNLVIRSDIGGHRQDLLTQMTMILVSLTSEPDSGNGDYSQLAARILLARCEFERGNRPRGKMILAEVIANIVSPREDSPALQWGETGQLLRAVLEPLVALPIEQALPAMQLLINLYPPIPDRLTSKDYLSLAHLRVVDTLIRTCLTIVRRASSPIVR